MNNDMNNHLDWSDDEFESSFASANFNPQLFTHEAHLRLAWIHIHKYGLEQAIINICKQLQTFVSVIGAAGKYHHTLTIAAIKIVDQFIQQKDFALFTEFMAENPRLGLDFKNLLHAHYSYEVISGIPARESWIEPDLLPFAWPATIV